MPTFISSNSIGSSEVHLTVAYDGINNSLNMFVGNATPENFKDEVDQASDILLQTSAYEIGSGFLGTMVDYKLTYGLNSEDLISTYSYKVENLFGYNFDKYKDGTNDQFSDNGGEGVNDLQASTPTGIKFVSDSYIPFVSSIEFNGNSYLELQGSNLDLSHTDNYNITRDGCAIAFWIDIESTGGPIVHIDGVIDVSYDGSNITMMTSNGTTWCDIIGSPHTQQFTNGDNNPFNMHWVFVCVVDTHSSSSNIIYVNGNTGDLFSSSNSLSPLTSSPNLFIGGYPGAASSNFIGKLDAVYGFKDLSGDAPLQIYEQFANDHAYTNTIEYLTQSTITHNWTHIAATYNKNSHKLAIYHNGKNFANYNNYIPNLDENAITDASNNSLLIGKDSTTYYDGALDDIRIYQNELSGADVEEVYNQYYQIPNEGQNSLIYNTGEINISNISLNNDSNVYVTFDTDAAPINGDTIKYLAIADDNLDARQIIDKFIIIEDTSFTTAVLNSASLDKVVTVSRTTPDLTFEVVDMSKVNDFDIFVYKQNGDNEYVGRANVNGGSNVGPHVHIDISDSILTATAFSAYANLSKYYVFVDTTSQTYDSDTVIRNGNTNFVSGVKNSVVTLDNISYSTNDYVYIVVEDANADRSSVVTARVT